MLIEQHAYHSTVKAVVFDWAGTTVDYGSFAPTAVFLNLFERNGVPITIAQARTPMGLMKKDHLRTITRMQPVADEWQRVHGSPCSEADIDRMFEDFVPMQMACLKEYAEPIPGAVEMVDRLHAVGIKVGSTTGYTREMMDILMPEAERRGYRPDASVCPTEVPAGRPYPWMCYQNAILLQVFPMQAIVKVGDTLPDIEEGLNAGMWTVGLALSGNALGLSQEDVKILPEEKLSAERARIHTQMMAAGAHYVVDGIWDCYTVIEEINERLGRGERP